jgi:Protein of unknown function (DUF3574)
MKIREKAEGRSGDFRGRADAQMGIRLRRTATDERQRSLLHSLLPLVLAIYGAPASAYADISCTAPTKVMARVDLVFGGDKVTSGAFGQFLAREVTPRFPDGLSLFEGYGQWRGAAKFISHERSRLLVIYYQPNVVSDHKIEAIRSAYKKRFGQKSVLRADSNACVAF